MQINLKQHEIEAALKGYISQQGINLSGKTVSISFTAGRKESGISADMSVEESDLPDFGSDDEDEKVPSVLVVSTEPQEAPIVPEVQVATPEPRVVQATEPAPAPSLFGG